MKTNSVEEISFLGDFDEVGHDQMAAVLKIIQQRDNLRAINFCIEGEWGDESKFGIFDEDVASLIAIVKNNTQLTTLQIKQSGLSEKGTTELMTSLIGNTSVKEFALTGCPCSIEPIIELIKKNGLTSLNIFNTNLRDREFEKIAPALVTNNTLIALNLDDNLYGLPGARAIQTVLKGNTTLSSLGLMPPHTDDTGDAADDEEETRIDCLKTILDGLQANSKVTEIFTVHHMPTIDDFELYEEEFRALILRNLYPKPVVDNPQKVDKPQLDLKLKNLQFAKDHQLLAFDKYHKTSWHTVII